jgi:conjugal transfer pilin signal peptidase TrbI
MSAAITIEKIRTYKPIVATWWAKYWPFAVAFVVAFLTLSHYVTFAVNITDSLPQKVFLILKQEKTVGRGEFAAFPWEGNRPYPAGLTFIKEVAAIPGDVITVDEKREFTVAMKPYQNWIPEGVGQAKAAETTYRSLGIAKKEGTVGNMKGVPLELGFTGTVPEGYFYMHAWHKDSLDSRYALLGLIPKEKIVGRAIPLF